MPLDPSRVPAAVRHLLPLAEAWGIGDDYDRERAVSTASHDELADLVHAVKDADDEALFGWLAGDESFSESPTTEYLAFTCMVMAFYSAKLELEHRAP